MTCAQWFMIINSVTFSISDFFEKDSKRVASFSMLKLQLKLIINEIVLAAKTEWAPRTNKTE